MKKTLSACCGLAVLLAIFVTSCKKETKYDVQGDRTNRVYLRTYEVEGAKRSGDSITFSVKNTPAGPVGKVSGAVPIRATMTASDAIAVKFAIDGKSVEAYNSSKGTAYKALPEDYVSLSQTVTIPAGSQVSKDSLKLSIPTDKLSQLADGRYLAPVVISSVSGGNNAGLSINQKTIFLIVDVSTTQLFDSPAESDMTGSLISDRSVWSATVNETPAFGDPSSLFDGDTNTYFYGSATPTITVDFKTTITNIQGFRLKSIYNSYGANTAIISSSNDGVTWTSYGSATLVEQGKGQFIKFYKAVTARYIRIQVTQAPQFTVAFTEFDVYK